MNEPIKVGDLTVRPVIRDGVPTGKWQLDVPSSLTGGTRKRVQYDGRDEALKIARELWKRLRLRELGFVGKPSRRHVSLEDAVTEWKRHEEDRVATLKKQQISLDTDAYRLKAIQAFFKGRSIAELDEGALMSYQKNRLALGIRPASINSEIRSLNKVFGWAVKNKYLDAIPKVERIPESGLEEVVVPTLEEVERIIAFLPKPTIALVWFLAMTGCRSGEAFHLTWGCVDEVNGRAEIKPNDGWRPKNKSSIRIVPLEGLLLEMIRHQPKTSRYVFPSLVDPKKPRTNMRKAFASAVKKAKIMRGDEQVLDITPKYLRKAFATWQANHGTAPRVLQALMGHVPGSTVTDKHYIKAEEGAMRVAVARMLPDKAV